MCHKMLMFIMGQPWFAPMNSFNNFCSLIRCTLRLSSCGITFLLPTNVQEDSNDQYVSAKREHSALLANLEANTPLYFELPKVYKKADAGGSARLGAKWGFALPKEPGYSLCQNYHLQISHSLMSQVMLMPSFCIQCIPGMWLSLIVIMLDTF